MLSKGNLLREPRALRIKFAKTGKLRFISHLDLCRTLTSAFLRAGIPIWYTQGFNPRPKLVFALTVSVGAESVAEYLDIRITREMSEIDLKRRLQNALTSDLEILEVYRPTSKLQDVAFADYEIFTERELDPEAVKAAVMGKRLFVIVCDTVEIAVEKLVCLLDGGLFPCAIIEHLQA